MVRLLRSICSQKLLSRLHPPPGPWDDEDEMTTDTAASGSVMNANSSQQQQQQPQLQSDLTDTQKHQLRHRELFLTRQIETLLATNIRGKCLVTLHNETEAFLSYLNAEVCREKISNRKLINLFPRISSSINSSTILTRRR